MNGFDRSDAAVLIGLILIGGSVWLVAGAQGVLAYAGAVLVLTGMAAAWERRTQRPVPPATSDTVFPGKHDRSG